MDLHVAVVLYCFESFSSQPLAVSSSCRVMLVYQCCCGTASLQAAGGGEGARPDGVLQVTDTKPKRPSVGILDSGDVIATAVASWAHYVIFGDANGVRGPR